MRLYGLRRAIWMSSFRGGWSAPRAASALGFVYVMQADGPAVKIGSSSDPERRRRELQTGSAAHLRILHVVPVYGDPIAVERAAQEMLAAHRVRLEWYDVPPDMAVGAIYAAAFRLGAMSPLLEAERPGALLRWLGAGALTSIPFWCLAATDHPLGAVVYLSAALAAWIAWWLVTRGRMVPSWLIGGAVVMGFVMLALPVKAAEPVPVIDGSKYCASIAGFVADNEAVRKGCLANEEKYERHIRAVWGDTPPNIKDQCRKTLTLVTPSYQGLAGCMSLAIGTMWMNGEVHIAPR